MQSLLRRVFTLSTASVHIKIFHKICQLITNIQRNDSFEGKTEEVIIMHQFNFHRKLKSAKHCLFVGCLLNVPATGECISGTDLLRQFYVLPH